MAYHQRSRSTPPDSRIIYTQKTLPEKLERCWTTGNFEAAQGQGQLGLPHRHNGDAHPRMPILTSNAMSPRVLSRPRHDSYQRPKILFYHKHEPHYGFTNFSSHPVMYGGRKYPTSEHLFQSFKFTHRPLLAEHIRTCSPRPSVAFSEARRFAREVRLDWSHENINAMNVVIYHKFTQHKDLKRELLATGNAQLIENSDKDAFWGCGADGKGRNELGKALERLRAQLREEERR